MCLKKQNNNNKRKSNVAHTAPTQDNIGRSKERTALEVQGEGHAPLLNAASFHEPLFVSFDRTSEPKTGFRKLSDSSTVITITKLNFILKLQSITIFSEFSYFDLYLSFICDLNNVSLHQHVNTILVVIVGLLALLPRH